MLSYYSKRSSGEGFQQTKHPHEYTVWVHGDTVTQDDVDMVAGKFHLSANILRDVRDVSELPRVEYGDDGTLYLFIRVPRLTKQKEIYTSPLLLVVHNHRFFTLAQSDVFHPGAVVEAATKSQQSSPEQLALITIAEVVAQYELLIHRISRVVRDVGYRLRSHEVTNKDFVRFVTIEDNLNECSTNLDGMKALAEHLKENRRRLLSSQDLELVDDIILHTQQLLVSVASQHQSVTSIRNAYSTIANNTLNQRMKTLTVFTVLIALPNVFYGMYGMNVALPWADEPWVYAAIVVFTIILILGVFFLARKFRIF